MVAALDEQGRWLEDDMINSATFIANVDLLARYVAATNGGCCRALPCSSAERRTASAPGDALARPGPRFRVARREDGLI